MKNRQSPSDDTYPFAFILSPAALPSSLSCSHTLLVAIYNLTVGCLHSLYYLPDSYKHQHSCHAAYVFIPPYSSQWLYILSLFLLFLYIQPEFAFDKHSTNNEKSSQGCLNSTQINLSQTVLNSSSYETSICHARNVWKSFCVEVIFSIFSLSFVSKFSRNPDNIVVIYLELVISLFSLQWSPNLCLTFLPYLHTFLILYSEQNNLSKM